MISVEEDLLNKVRTLPLEKQRKVLDFVQRLEEPTSKKKAGKSLAGLWAKYKIDISAEDIKELRREMWAKFPRDL